MDLHLSRGWLAVALLLALATPATGQVFAEATDSELSLRGGETRVVVVQLSNPTDREYFFLAVAGGDLPGRVEVDAREGSIAARSVLAVNVTVEPRPTARPGSYDVEVTVAIVDRQSGTTFDRDASFVVRVDRSPLLLQVVPSPFPAPFEHGWGLLLVEAVVWSLVALAASWIGARVVHHWADRATEATRGRMAAGMRRPLALLILFGGLQASWRLVEDEPGMGAVARLNQLIVIVLAGVLAYRAIQAALVYAAGRQATRAGKPRHDVLFPLLQKSAAVVLGVMVALQALRILGLDVSVLLAGGVVVGLVLSLAAQDTLSNLFSGLFILADQPFREGDEVRLSTGEVCRVDRIGLRSTRLFHFRHEQQMIVPNNALASERVTNLSYPDQTYRLRVELEVEYHASLAEAMSLLKEAALATPDVMRGPGRDPVVYLRSFQESGVLLEVRVYIPSSRHRNPVRTALMLAMKETLDRHGIAIPVPQREVRLIGGDASRLARGPDGEAGPDSRPDDTDPQQDLRTTARRGDTGTRPRA